MTSTLEPMQFFEIAFKSRGLAMEDFQRERFVALAPALTALATDQKPDIGRFWWEGTKGSSKDSDLALALLWLMAFTSKMIDGQIGAADLDQADEMRKAAKDWLAAMPWLQLRVKIQNWKILGAQESHLTFVAADTAGGAHGSRCLVYVINEISHISRTEFVDTQLDNATKVPNGIVIVATNAGFIGTEAWKHREIARTSPGRWSFHVFAQPAPWLDAKELDEAARRNTPARYARLFNGVWSDGVGDALTDAEISAAINRDLFPLTSRIPGVGFVGGLDLGLKADHAGFVVVGASHRRNGAHYRLAKSECWKPRKWDDGRNEVDLEAVESAVLNAKQTFGLQAICYDEWQAAYMAQRLTKAGVRMVPVGFQGKSATEMATNLLEMFQNRVFSMYEDARLIADLKKLSIAEQSSGKGYKLIATRDANGHADVGTACVLALLAARNHCQPLLTEPWGGVIQPTGQMGGGWFGSKKGVYGEPIMDMASYLSQVGPRLPRT